MTLTVRLDSALESALERASLERGVTKSLVVQEALADYLLAGDSRGAPESPTGGRHGSAVETGAAYRAFSQAGLIGGGELGGVSATKDVVRRVAMERLRKKAG